MKKITIDIQLQYIISEFHITNKLFKAQHYIFAIHNTAKQDQTSKVSQLQKPIKHKV